MVLEGNLRKMDGELNGSKVSYELTLYDVLEPMDPVDLGDLIGKEISIEYKGYINSILSGERIKKAFGEGLTYTEFMESPQASPSIMRPELSRIHEGVALRDYAWEVKHHLQPHTVYIALTSGFKVGVTRDTNIPYRWIDQGAVKATRLAHVPYRQLAGLIEVALKPFISDKTAWQKMLKGVQDDDRSIEEVKQAMAGHVPDEFKQFLLDDMEVVDLEYPLLHSPEKVKSTKLDKEHRIEGMLIGVKGQYLIFDDDRVFNVRSHSGYRIKLEK